LYFLPQQLLWIDFGESGNIRAGNSASSEAAPPPDGMRFPVITRLFERSSIPALQDVASFTQARHGVLAGNVANVHTPGYRTRDLSVKSFQEALRKSIEARRQGDIASPGFEETPRVEASKEVHAAMTNLVYHDDTNIDIERQVVEISKNQYLHNLAVSIMASQFQSLQTAINERA
jgi:flagellar basal-body rod protein FlgB